MNAEKERAVDRWFKEFSDEYLTGNLERAYWREISGVVVFCFAFKYMTVAIEYHIDEIPMKPTKFWLDEFESKLAAEILSHFIARW